MIRHVKELKGDATGAAVIVLEKGDAIEGLYYKCPESGDVEIHFVDPPIGVPLKLVLQDGNDSDYRGVIGADGNFRS